MGTILPLGIDTTSISNIYSQKNTNGLGVKFRISRGFCDSIGIKLFSAGLYAMSTSLLDSYYYV